MLPVFADWIAHNIALRITIVAGLFAVIKYLDQRQRELQQRRFEEYWKLIGIFLESERVDKQQIELLLLKRYPDYGDETRNFLSSAKQRNDPWTQTKY